MEASMAERTMVEAMAAVEFLIDDLDAICREAVATYRRYPPEFVVEHDARAGASCTYCHMLSGAERRFEGRPGVVFKDIRGLKVWLVGDAAVLRFKKMDEEGHSRNYPTKQAQDYDRQAALPGIPAPAVRLSVGYLLDPTGTEVVRVQVAKPMDQAVGWCAAIVPHDERASGTARWIDVTRQSRAI
jgi:hypothetical protein